MLQVGVTGIEGDEDEETWLDHVDDRLNEG
jgi:hypothetical protein